MLSIVSCPLHNNLFKHVEICFTISCFDALYTVDKIHTELVEVFFFIYVIFEVQNCFKKLRNIFLMLAFSIFSN